LEGLYQITKSFTSEWGIRPFLLQHRDMTLSFLHEWTSDPNPHVRRLVSEGSRPYLPWGKKLAFVEKDPETTLPLLRKLKTDESEDVRRSVANHLNDLTKKHNHMIIEELEIWNTENSGKNMARLIRHALRSAIKEGHPKALELLGYIPNIKAIISDLTYTRKVPFTGKFEFQFSLTSKEKKAINIMLDFIIYFQKANGITQPKVFKLRDLKLSPGATLRIIKKVSFKPITTRKYYPGLHYVQFLINGNPSDKHEFYLEHP
jgi:3-methyladenine DNA glycosylase AlkC